MKTVKVAIVDLHFQYIPEKFFKDLYPGSESDMLKLHNTPHYRFLKLYEELGKDIWDCYEETDYFKLMKRWGRDDKFSRKKIKRLIGNYRSILKDGLQSNITVLNEPLYKKHFNKGYEIWNGHHRAVICCVLGYKNLNCFVREKK